MTKKTILSFVLALACLPSPSRAALKVVTTTQDLAALAKEVGGEFVEAEPIAKGYQDPHFVEAKPSYLLKLRRADLFIQVGLELETGWVPSLLSNARNPRILPGNPGFLDASEGCDILEKPKGPVDRSLGDVHPLGNPHYWLDPSNGLVIAQRIAGRLEQLDPGHAEAYKANAARFEAALAAREKAWDEEAKGLKGLKVITYHNSWPNFARRFGLDVVDFVELRPGIPASPAHLRSLTAHIRSQKVPVILIEPYFDDKLPRKVASETGARLVIAPPSVGAEPAIVDYFGLFDRILELLVAAAPAGTQ
ncbi:MAG: zinc ABC transporter substrate-binding protein [Elusimicrobia bacterium]|nr:zinc ABC transporter substrate-binding protein [Elusimicrobiota bacterium]